jgi:hypothetical protein
MTKNRHYDGTLKDIFSHPEMVELFIKTFIVGNWIKDIDFTTLQPLRNEHIGPGLEKRTHDLCWKMAVNTRWLYLVLHLELQSSNNKYMALRVLRARPRISSPFGIPSWVHL